MALVRCAVTGTVSCDRGAPRSILKEDTENPGEGYLRQGRGGGGGVRQQLGAWQGGTEVGEWLAQQALCTQ